MKTNPHQVLLGMEDGGGRDGWMDGWTRRYRRSKEKREG